MKTPFTEHAKIELPVICGAMYPCSNPDLVAAASREGGIGIVQPISLVFVRARIPRRHASHQSRGAGQAYRIQCDRREIFENL